MVAWLAMLAIGLLVVAPSLSRITSTPSMAAAMGEMCDDHAHNDSPRPNDHRHADALDACAYCVLVSHGTALGGTVVFSVPPAPAAPAATPLTGRSITTVHVWRQPARGPPTRPVSVFATT
ncbi:hypothetical protein HY57_10170 [Dyella japonica A8]|uniref:DUF2946 domain-containing protein n=2 Tax=Dyella japonica TaxID=231455 RepID=A0A075JZW0_9GAMM|nr:hypothetical protein HY57_10170 [Dyella japonica A8]